MSYASEEAVRNAQWNAANMAFATEEMRQRPSVLFRPKIMQDGDAWIALLGEDLQVGVVGTGKTPDEAMADFDRAWKAPAVAHARVPFNQEVVAAARRIAAHYPSFPNYEEWDDGLTQDARTVADAILAGATP